ncbi:hypothetical protein Q9R38_14500 [Priestia aryabhattai]|uniref:hypothetical protein n=1 Tax=Priestia TaxID=2800373 RepID=UPI00064F24BF|nr:hypothetical protein [Priestia aryabhattai]KML31418.1 hypothetical protein VL11_02370 [Priestia aryabhattai]KMN93138.1 hypothetical protein ABV89_26240 [Priestia aryabhattai]MDT0147725.1 hypothetical protein [Priestia aryabhattai]MDT0154408.1 hypothetical protein [Priestia aryabhattai]MED4000289.1 hypothetical protein [Priestia aryabhattai]
MDEKQIQLFEALRMIKDQWVDVSLIKLESGIEKLNLQEQQNEIIESVICSMMEMIDGYNNNLNFSLDLVDKDTKESLKGRVELHDKFMEYLEKIENKN